MLSGGPRAKPQRLKPARLLVLYGTAGSRAFPNHLWEGPRRALDRIVVCVTYKDRR